MAAELEQIFQDFILNKIREIEGQSEDKGTTGVKEVDDGEERGERREDTPARESSKKPKKHKKHKSKKKKKKREKDSSSESEREGKSRTSAEAATDPGEEHKSRHHRQHSGGKKKKKKKRRRKEDENSSDSDSKQKEESRGASVRRQEELPDIIPKQDSSGMGRGDSPSHSCSQSHSCSETKDSSPHHRRSSTPSNSSEKKATCEDPVQSQTQSSSEHLQLPQPAETQAAEPQNSEERRSSTERKEASGNPGADASLSSSDNPAKPQTLEKPSATRPKSPAKKSRRRSRSPRRSKERKSSKKPRRSRSPHRSHRRGSRSRSPSHRKRSRSRSGGRKSWRRSRSSSRSRRRVIYNQRDRWKREPSRSPVLILRKNRSSPTARKHCPASSSSPQRISDLDKEQLLEIAKANAAAMCAKAGMPIPASLRTNVLPLALPSMAMNAAMASMTAATVTAALSNIGTLSSLLPLPSITNKPPSSSSGTQPSSAALEEVKRKVTKQANSISIKEFTDKCRMIVDSTGELPVAQPHVSDEEEDGKPFGGTTLREQKVISFSINNTTVRPAGRTDVEMAKEFPVSSGSQHRKKEGEGQAAYGEWVPVEKSTEKAPAPSRKAQSNQSVPSSSSTSEPAAAAPPEVVEKTDNDVFPEPPQQPVDITQAVTERIKAQRRLAENPYDISAICMLSRAQEQVDAWAQSSTVPGLFTGSTGAQVLTSEELSNTGPQAWLKKDQFLRAAPVSGGVGEFLMRKMGWRTGEGLGRNREGTIEPIVIDFKVDRKGLVAEGEKPQKQTGGLVVTKDLMGKHPVSALIELCSKRRIVQPDFVMVHHSGPDHRKNFLFKVTVNGVDYQPQTASPNKKHAKAMAATVALQALGEVPSDGPGLYTGPVFTAASTGPLFST